MSLMCFVTTVAHVLDNSCVGTNPCLSWVGTYPGRCLPSSLEALDLE